MACWTIIAFCVAVPGMAAKGLPQDAKSEDTSNVTVVPLKDGYCNVDGPLFILAKAGAEFTFTPEIEYKGKKFQVQKPISKNAYGVSSISVQLMTKTKKPSGPVKELKSDSQTWNEKQKTVDFHYGGDTIQVVVHIYPVAMGGFVIKDIECLPPEKGR
jgi:hypothetical protein